MKEKICFWINRSFLQFGVAKFIQDHSDYELYAIADSTVTAKDFLLNQNIINFKKVWFFGNELIQKKPDYEYLESFEKKYDINLLLIASMEKWFYKEYNQYHKFSEDEILYLLEQECKFFKSILDTINPNFIFFTSIVGHHQNLFYKMCKKQGVQPLIADQLRFGFLFAITDKLIYEFDTEIKFDKSKYKQKSPEEIKDFLQSYKPHQRLYSVENPEEKFKTSKTDRLKALFQFPFLQQPPSFNYRTYGRTKMSVLLKGNARLNSLKFKKREKYINTHLSQKIDESFPFVYFPLHEEPEQILLMGAPFYTDQISVIKNIAKSLPVGYKLYVKDHPGMSIFGWRDKSFYEEIMNIPHVRLIHHKVSSEELTKKSSLVITIRGTATLEAAFLEKPSICFYSDLGYSTIPSIYVLKDLKELPHAIKISLQKIVHQNDLSDYVNWNEENAFEFHYEKYANDVAHRFKVNVGYLQQPVINYETVKPLLKDYADIYEKFGKEYLQKIKSIKSLK